ncbi:phage tail tape measure protein, partial [Clostridium sp.]|uniref:phage tail tape measure protein n=1 Tax=Clostridium sp. TaxID=1506 RepID=UPI0025811C2C
MELFTLFGKIAVNDKDANKSIDSVTGKAKQSESVMGKAFSNIGKVVAGAFTVGAIATFEKKIVSTYATYDDQMRKVQAVSGATGKQFMELRSKAEELGAKTRFSATEAGEGMEMLARAGWKTGDIMKGIGPVLNFATANAIDLGQAAGIVSDGLSQFGLKAKDTTMFTDVLSATAAAANTDIGLLGETFKYVGPVAGSLGYKLQDVSVAIGLMANKGIKGSQAGTSLRSALTRLANPTGDSAKLMKELGISITDSTGKVKPFNALMQELRGKFSKLSDAQKAQYASTIFGQEAMSGMLAVVNSSDEEFNKMTKAIAESSGQTQKMANTMDGGLGGALANVQSAWEGLLIKLGEMQDGPLVDGLNGLAKILQGLPNEIQYVSNKFKEFTNFLKEHETAIKTIGIIFGTIMTGFVLNSLKLKIAEKGVLAFIKSFGLVKNIGPMLKGVGTVFTFLTTSVGLVTIGVAAFAAAAYLIYKNWDKIGPWLKNQWEFIKNTASDVWNGIKEIVFNVVESVVQFIQDVWGGLVNIVNTVFTAVGNAISTAWNFIKTIFTVALLAIKFVVQTGFALIVTIIRVPLELIKALFQTIWNFIGGYVMNVINTIVTFITTAWNNVVTVTSTVFNAVANVVSTIWNAIYGVIAGVVGTVAGYVSSIWATIVAYTTTYFNAAKVVVQSVW